MITPISRRSSSTSLPDREDLLRKFQQRQQMRIAARFAERYFGAGTPKDPVSLDSDEEEGGGEVEQEEDQLVEEVDEEVYEMSDTDVSSDVEYLGITFAPARKVPTQGQERKGPRPRPRPIRDFSPETERLHKAYLAEQTSSLSNQDTAMLALQETQGQSQALLVEDSVVGREEAEAAMIGMEMHLCDTTSFDCNRNDDDSLSKSLSERMHVTETVRVKNQAEEAGRPSPQEVQHLIQMFVLDEHDASPVQLVPQYWRLPVLLGSSAGVQDMSDQGHCKLEALARDDYKESSRYFALPGKSTAQSSPSAASVDSVMVEPNEKNPSLEISSPVKKDAQHLATDYESSLAKVETWQQLIALATDTIPAKLSGWSLTRHQERIKSGHWPPAPPSSSSISLSPVSAPLQHSRRSSSDSTISSIFDTILEDRQTLSPFSTPPLAGSCYAEDDKAKRHLERSSTPAIVQPHSLYTSTTRCFPPRSWPRSA
ncbi:hypothetical protein CBS101457_003158 [Exobasidium rhododendri]|nr:hypothetical protein CBS101457_003158 [Exobasidium rhododendri]